MTTGARPRLVLFDFDDVLARYSHHARIAHLAQHCGVAGECVPRVLFESGLESEYDGGLIDTATYRPGSAKASGLRSTKALWIAARVQGAASILRCSRWHRQPQRRRASAC